MSRDINMQKKNMQNKAGITFQGDMESLNPQQYNQAQLVNGDNMMQRIKGFWRNTMNWSEILSTTNSNKRPAQYLQWLSVSLLLVTLYGCGNSVSNGVDPNSGSSPVGAGSTLNLTPDQSAFWRSLHQPIFRQYCKTCHEPGGSGIGEFSHRTDIVHAYGESVPRVDRNDPANSFFVTKVAGGHNCWVIVNNQPDCAQSALQLASAISNWVNSDPAEIAADESDTATTEDIDIAARLLAPPDAAPVAEAIVLGITPGADEAAYASYIWGNTSAPYVSADANDTPANCGRCHSESAPQAQRQQPYFADSDLTVAFAALVDTRKIDINTPANSRMYLRLAQDSHNCWSDCTSNAATMLTAIENWKTAITTNPAYSQPIVDGEGTTPLSQGLELNQGQVISGGKRYDRNLVALWEFKEGSGSSVADTSGVSPPLDLVLVGQEGSDYDWVGGWGIDFKGGYARGTSTAASQKIYDLIAPRNEFTIEAWVVPGNVSQEGPAVIASYSSGVSNRNFTMGQTLYSYEFLNRNTASGLDPSNTANGNPTLITDPDDEDLQATQQHVVMTYDPVNGRRIYVNGQFTGDTDPILGGTLTEWDDGYLFVLGAETNGINNRWAGKLRLVALYNRALTEEQITQNFDAGVGQKFNLLFKVGHLSTQLPDESYIWFEVAEFDNYAYLFANPAFVVLGANPSPASFSAVVRGMRIGVNGKEAPVGQVFLNMDKTVTFPFPNQQSYEALIDTTQGTVDGQSVTIPVSATGTIIAKQNGPNATPPDQFYLTFEELADQSDVRTDPVSSGSIAYNYPAPTAGLTDNSFITGVRTFEEINATMAELTDIPITNSTVRPVFLELQQQLPGGPALQGFLASNQMGISKLALTYCGELVDDANERADVFGTIDLATVFDTPTSQSNIVTTLYNRMIGQNITGQPSLTEVSDLLIGTGGLLERLCPAGNCGAARNATILKSMCVSVLSSAAVSTQ